MGILVVRFTTTIFIIRIIIMVIIIIMVMVMVIIMVIMVMMKGEEGETFYFIEEGQARVMISRGDGEESQQVKIKQCMYSGL